MKKVYESPVMMAEAYETNAYCGACNTVEKLDNMILDSSCKYYSDRWGESGWSAGGYDFEKSDLYHEFGGTPSFYSDGICNPGNCESIAQPIWKCICDSDKHPGETWYLEWSHHYSVHENGGKNGDVFFLYKEAGANSNNANSFDIIHNSTSWPAKESGSDYNVARVIYRNGERVVANS